MSVPYEIAPFVTPPVGDIPIVFPIEWPHRSVISKLIVQQIEGALEDFTVALFNHPSVMAGDSISDSVGDDQGPIPVDCFRSSANLSGVNGTLIYFSENANGGCGYVIFSQQGRAGRQGQRENKIYMRITPTGSALKRFAVAIGGHKEIE